MKVKLTKLVLPKDEIDKLSPKEKKRYIMFTCMLRDLNLLQKCLVFVGNENYSDTPSKSAKTTMSVYFLNTLISKIHEMWIFLQKNKVMDGSGSTSNELRKAASEVEGFFSEQKVDAICSFIRNKFGFHYEYWDDIDVLIDDALKQFEEFEVWLSSEDSANEIFASSNAVILKVIFSEMKRLGFLGDEEKLFDALFGLALKGARALREFSVVYLAEAFRVNWVQREEVEIEAPRYSQVKLPLIVAK